MRLNFSVTILTASAAVPLLGVLASNSLSYDELNSVIKTVATSGFDFANSAIRPGVTDATFSSTVETQWNINTEQPDVTAPYLVCETTPGLSGHERAERIETLCNRKRFGQNVVQNLEDRTCFNDQLVPAAALTCSTSDENIHVVPYSSWNKISAVSFISSLGENFDVVESVRYAGNFCEDLPTAVENSNRNVAKRALKQAFSDNTDCVSSLVTVGGTGVSFTDIFSLKAKESRLLLHQVEGTVALPVGCMLSLVESLGSHPFVCSVEYDPHVTTFNHQARWIIQGSVYGDNNSMDLPLHQVGISGENQVAQMSDTGLSVNSCYFYDKNGEVVRDMSANVDSARRKVVQYYAKVSSEDENGHGTHCAGTILGKVCPYGDVGCSTSSNRDGTAPEAKIAVYDIGDSKYLYPDNSNPMFVRGMAAGATVHSASWGNGVNSYQSRDLDYDRFQHQNDGFLVIFAAGNSGSNNKGNTSSSVAKNNLNVCASRNKGQGLGELYTAYFSSMGPSADGRIKPDICAPGHSISSANKGLTRQCNSVFKSGTSMACPGVAGAALLVRQYFVDGFSPSGTKVPEDGFEPSGALVKAVILNSGRVMLGRDNSDRGLPVFASTEFDESQGFGLISLVDGLYLKDKSKGKVHIWDREPLTSGQEWEKSFKLGTCEAAHTSVTLTYFDKENSSTSCNPCIINRLDLTIEKDGVTYYPNGLAGADVKNNSQRIRIPHVAGDSLMVKVRAANLATAEQKFALAVSGCLDVDVDTNEPTRSPTTAPSPPPTDSSTLLPTKSPTSSPTKSPTSSLTKSPTSTPTDSPTLFPTKSPTLSTTKPSSTSSPTKSLTSSPTKSPTSFLTKSPTLLPTESPTLLPTEPRTVSPSVLTGFPTGMPTVLPAESPTLLPTESPTPLPTKSPTASPTVVPTKTPTGVPTKSQTESSTLLPTESPTPLPTESPTASPTGGPTKSPSGMPTVLPVESPSLLPTESPTPLPTESPTALPTESPTRTEMPSPAPQAQKPTLLPTLNPTSSPTYQKTWNGCNKEVRDTYNNRISTIKTEHQQRMNICPKNPWRARRNCNKNSLNVYKRELKATLKSMRDGYKACKTLYGR